jgi:hypothetical protein
MGISDLIAGFLQESLEMAEAQLPQLILLKHSQS